MKARKIYYKRLFSLGNYQNEEIGIEIEIEEGEKANDVLQKAKEFVIGLDPSRENERKYNDAIAILKDKDAYNYKRVIEAEEIVRQYESKIEIDDLPF